MLSGHDSIQWSMALGMLTAVAFCLPVFLTLLDYFLTRKLEKSDSASCQSEPLDKPAMEAEEFCRLQLLWLERLVQHSLQTTSQHTVVKVYSGDTVIGTYYKPFTPVVGQCFLIGLPLTDNLHARAGRFAFDFENLMALPLIRFAYTFLNNLLLYLLLTLRLSNCDQASCPNRIARGPFGLTEMAAGIGVIANI